MSKDQPSTPEARHITSLTTTNRQCSIVNSIRLDHVPPCVCVMERHILRRNRRKTCPIYTPSKASDFTSGLLSYAVSGSSNTCPNLDQRRTGHVAKALSVVGWRTIQIKCCDSKKQGAFSLRVDTLNGMCVQCLWVSKSFFVVDFLKTIYIPEK